MLATGGAANRGSCDSANWGSCEPGEPAQEEQRTEGSKGNCGTTREGEVDLVRPLKAGFETDPNSATQPALDPSSKLDLAARSKLTLAVPISIPTWPLRKFGFEGPPKPLACVQKNVSRSIKTLAADRDQIYNTAALRQLKANQKELTLGRNQFRAYLE